MSAPGFPSRNPLRQGNIQPVIPPAISGGLMEWLSWNFPTVYEQAADAGRHRQGIYDYKSKDYARQFPTRSGRVP